MYQCIDKAFLILLLLLIALGFAWKVYDRKLSLRYPRHDFALNLYHLELSDIFFPATLEVYKSRNILWKLHLLEQKDLPLAADLALECFYKPKIKLDDHSMNPSERTIFNYFIKLLNYFDRSEVWLSNYIGFSVSGGDRLKVPSLRNTHHSIILVATDPRSSFDRPIGIVEVCLDEISGHLFSPVRNLFQSNKAINKEPYLCNLAISKDYRRLGLGRFLCEACENIAVTVWAKENMYLHVERSNQPAVRLYENMGYQEKIMLTDEDIRKYKMQDISYYHRKLL
jgi:ribosomal protein S18 acetylase RimI-like enzyme